MELNWADTSVVTYDQTISKKIAGYSLLYDLTRYFLLVDFQQTTVKKEMLVIGAGGGQELVTFAPINPQLHFTAIDSSKPMLERAQQRAMEYKSQIEYALTSWKDYQVNTTYDAASCLLVLHFIKDYEEKRQFLKKIADSLQSGAKLYFATMYKEDEPSMSYQLAAWKGYMLHHQISEDHATQFEQSFDGHYHLIKEEELLTLLQSCGFTSISRYFHSFLLAGYICIKE